MADDEEPNRLLLMLGVATAVAGFVMFALWPRERAVAREAPGALFTPPIEGIKVAQAKDDGRDRGNFRAEEMVHVRSSDVDKNGAASVVLNALEQQPAIAATVRQVRMQETGGELAAVKKVLGALRDKQDFLSSLQNAAAGPGMGPALEALSSETELAPILDVARAAAAGGASGGDLRNFRSAETRAGLISKGVARGSMPGSVPSAKGGEGAGGAPGAGQGGGAPGGPGATGGPGAVGGGVPAFPGAVGNLKGIPGGAPALATWGSQGGGSGGDEKSDDVLEKYPYLGEVFNRNQLNSIHGDIERQGVWATCMAQRQYARCQAACETSRPAANGVPPACSTGSAWSACMGAFRNEQRCIRDCKAQSGCQVPAAVYNKHCSAGGFKVPPSYCLGF
ncbi:MAG: hypothetical protein HY553_06025 [Elusimicrobia bacterium]|nr:hypothetical protein [Elusimicrobiota bacterium]